MGNILNSLHNKAINHEENSSNENGMIVIDTINFDRFKETLQDYHKSEGPLTVDEMIHHLNKCRDTFGGSTPVYVFDPLSRVFKSPANTMAVGVNKRAELRKFLVIGNIE